MGRLHDLIVSTPLPRGEAVALLSFATGLARERIVGDSDSALDERDVERFHVLAARRGDGVPLAYLVGMREFYGRPFFVDERVLIPRPETELLVDEALRRIDAQGGRALRLLDLGTGSGAIAITLALERPDLDVTATDLSDDALDVARRNAASLQAGVRLVASDWFGSVDGRFDLIVSNPPYVARDDHHLAEGDLRFEPRRALTDGADGTTALARIAAGARDVLNDHGMLMLEHGHDQASVVRAMLRDAGYRDVRSIEDLAGIERVTGGSFARALDRGA